MSLFRPIRASELSDRPVRVWETGPTKVEFRAEWSPQPAVEQAASQRFPRNWIELEAFVAERLSQYEERHQQGRQKAFEEGVQEGMRRREKITQRKLEAARAPIALIGLAAEQELAAVRSTLYDHVATLTAALGEAWLRQIVAVNPMVFSAALRDALEPLSHIDDITIRLNPEDYRTLTEGIAAEAEETLEFEGLRLLSDTSVSRGGVVAESEGGSVDCRLETRVEQALKIIHAAHHDD